MSAVLSRPIVAQGDKHPDLIVRTTEPFNAGSPGWGCAPWA